MSGSYNLHALAVKDPWATVIAIGAKRVETRVYRTRHRGPIAIHSSKAFGREEQALCLQEPFQTTLQSAWIRSLYDMPRGAIIAVAELVGCDQLQGGQDWEVDIPPEPERGFGIYQPGRWMWRLQDIRPLPEAVSCRGMLGLWTVPPDVLAAVSVQRVP